MSPEFRQSAKTKFISLASPTNRSKERTLLGCSGCVEAHAPLKRVCYVFSPMTDEAWDLALDMLWADIVLPDVTGTGAPASTESLGGSCHPACMKG